MATAETLRASLLACDGAHTLRSLVEDLARKWTSNVHRCEDSNAVFDTLRDIVAGAISNVARAWNPSHDVLRALPAEVQEQCFGSLPVPDRCRLSMICSHWSTNVANLPGIWTRVELGGWYRAPAPAALLARSGHLPLDVTLKTHADRTSCEDALRLHATRLRKLEICDGFDALEFPVPHLEDLSITKGGSSSSVVSHMLFDQNAPRLRTLCLTSLSMPLKCPAFRSVTTLTLRYNSGTLDHLFEQMPYLKTLNINGHSHHVILPALPRRSSLQALQLVDVFITVELLVRLGYSDIDDLGVAATTGSTSQFEDAMARWSALPATLRMRANWDFEIVLRPDGRRLGFAARSCYFDTFERLFSERRTESCQIQRLVLPTSFREGPYDYSDLSFPPFLVRPDDVIVLPAVRTLAVECSNIREPIDMYPLRQYVRGVFEVPRLARIEVLRAIEVPCDVPVEPVEASDLLALVENILVCDDRASLDVFVDTASGISLIGDVDRLRACVGRLVT